MMRYRITIEIEGTIEQIKLDAGRTLEQLARRMETVENDRHLKELMFASGGGGFPYVGCSVRAAAANCRAMAKKLRGEI